MVQVAIIGDLHGHLDPGEVDSWNDSREDLFLFVGDLEPLSASVNPLAELTVARRLSKLTKPALLIPGNHDGALFLQLFAEVVGSRALVALGGLGQGRRVKRLEEALAPVQVSGYGLHPFELGGERFDVITARPFSMGGPSLAFRPLLARRWGLGSIEASTLLLRRLVERSSAERLIFLAHNGPTGLGEARDDLWGRDFGRGEGDWGDRDLELAVAHARRLGKEVLAVVAGHMHHQVRGGGQRPFHVERDGVHYLNAGRVPRCFEAGGRRRCHRLRLSIEGGEVTVDELISPSPASRTD